MRSDEEGVSISGKAAHNVALGIEHPEAIPYEQEPLRS
jgi:hypothetical protein